MQGLGCQSTPANGESATTGRRGTNCETLQQRDQKSLKSSAGDRGKSSPGLIDVDSAMKGVKLKVISYNKIPKRPVAD